MTFAADHTSSEGHRALANRLAEDGKIEAAIEAMKTAADLDPLNADRLFDHAALLIQLAKTQSPYFRGATWGQALRSVERGMLLDPTSEVGPQLIGAIRQHQASDEAATEDHTPMTQLPRGLSRRHPNAIRGTGGRLLRKLRARKNEIRF
jgi:regulator of sirC expression with transglutaminase-like and TPR domain